MYNEAQNLNTPVSGDPATDDMYAYLQEMLDTGELEEMVQLMLAFSERYANASEYGKTAVQIINKKTAVGLPLLELYKLAWYLSTIWDGSILADLSEPHDMTDVEADANTLKSAGMGVDEDYVRGGDHDL